MTIKAHFDGKVFVPDEPVDLRAGDPVTVQPAAPARKKTGADVLAAVSTNPELKADWDAIAAGRDSTEVARELRRQTWAPRLHDPD